MADKHIPANAAYLLKKHGVTATITDLEIIDIGPDDLSLIVSVSGAKYFIDAADYLPVDKDLSHMLAKINAERLEIIPLTDEYGGRDSVEMFDHIMLARVYKII